MTQSYFIGVDISKQKLDLALIDSSNSVLLEQQISNSDKAIFKLLKSLESKFKVDLSDLLVCCEATGIYCKPLERVCLDNGIDLWVESAYKVKKASHDIRGKSDQKDARRIADYALRYQDKQQLQERTAEDLGELKTLQNIRTTLLKTRTMYSNQLKEAKTFDLDTYTELKKIYTPILKKVEAQLAKIELQVQQIIANSGDLKKNHDLLTSIPGIGTQNAIQFIIWTQNFTRFNNAKQLACYTGVVPFPNQSGTMNKRDRVSHHANKELKKIIHMAAISSLQIKGEMRQYYERKVSQGKAKMSVINAIRNKLIQRMFAVVERGTPYVILNNPQIT